MRFIDLAGLSLVLLTGACGQATEVRTDGVIVVGASASMLATVAPSLSPLPETGDAGAAAEQRQQEAFDLTATDRYPTLPPDRLELARDTLAGDGTDGA